MALNKKYGPWVLVTGASRGIGAAFAHELAKQGFNIVLTARNAAKLGALAATLRANHGVETREVPADLADAAQVADLLDQATADLDIGLVVLNAAIAQFGQLHKTAPEAIKLLIDVNILSTALLAHRFAARLVARGGGGLMLLSSNGAYVMLPNEANYAASKAYVAHLGEILHYELKARKVDVLTVFPPLVDTDMITAHEVNSEWDFAKLPAGFGVKTRPEVVAVSALNALGRRVRVHPPRLSEIFMWIVRRLPDRLRCGFFDNAFSKAVAPENSWR